jgi:hypothetical protein
MTMTMALSMGMGILVDHTVHHVIVVVRVQMILNMKRTKIGTSSTAGQKGQYEDDASWHCSGEPTRPFMWSV